jgi:hypothetical protein
MVLWIEIKETKIRPAPTLADKPIFQGNRQVICHVVIVACVAEKQSRQGGTFIRWLVARA